MTMNAIPGKYRHVFASQMIEGLIKVPNEIAQLVPLGKTLSITIEYDEDSKKIPIPSAKSYLDALDDVHDSYP